MNSFRSQFSPIIRDVIKDHDSLTSKEIKRKLQEKWRNDVRTPANSYMASEWSREAMRQLKRHPSSQRPLKELPLFAENG